MELNWTTFILEILNFLVLVWLLQRLFYKPVKEMIAKRQQSIEDQLQKAGEMQKAAKTLRDQYENRLVDWENERQDARTHLAHEIELERQQLMVGLQQDLATERKKDEVLAERLANEQQFQSETRAMELGAMFASKLLKELGSAEIEIKLIELLMAEVKHLPPEQKTALATMIENGQPPVVLITSAYPVDGKLQQSLKKYFDSLLSSPCMYTFVQDRELIAGLRITVGPWIIHANLHDELKTFAAIAHEK